MLITPEYCELNRRLHADAPTFGANAGRRTAATIIEMRAFVGAETVLDYGCGKGTLAASVPFPVAEYDPAILGKDAPPEPADLVVCIDVLEHVEPECLDPVLADLARLTKKAGFFTIHTGASSHTLPDGRNAHLIQKPLAWWRDKLRFHFRVVMTQHLPPTIFVTVRK